MEHIFKNKQNSNFAKVKNGIMSAGQNVVQYDFDGDMSEQWIFTLNSNTGYYSIKSANSSELCYYMTVSDNSSSLDEPIVIRSATETTLVDGMKWKIEKTSSGAYKIIPKTGEANDYVLATSTSLGTNNVNLIQGDYILNNSYRDEWLLFDITKNIRRFHLTILEHLHLMLMLSSIMNLTQMQKVQLLLLLVKAISSVK